MKRKPCLAGLAHGQVEVLRKRNGKKQLRPRMSLQMNLKDCTICLKHKIIRSHNNAMNRMGIASGAFHSSLCGQVGLGQHYVNMTISEGLSNVCGIVRL
jgi:hypothetical protein